VKLGFLDHPTQHVCVIFLLVVDLNYVHLHILANAIIVM